MEKESISRLLNGSVREARTLSSVNQRSIVAFLYLKGLSAKDINTELLQVLGSDDDAISCTIVTKYIRNDIS
jgi:hypothetical protein